MCDPVSIVMVAGTAITAYGQVQAGNAADKEAGIQATQTEQAGSYEAGRIRDQTKAARGQAVGGMAASGVKIGQGSALETERQILTVGETDAMMTLLNSQNQADAIRRGGAQAKKAGQIGAVGTVLGAAANMLSWGGGSEQYNYNNDASGMKYSATGADIRARR